MLYLNVQITDIRNYSAIVTRANNKYSIIHVNPIQNCSSETNSLGNDFFLEQLVLN